MELETARNSLPCFILAKWRRKQTCCVHSLFKMEPRSCRAFGTQSISDILTISAPASSFRQSGSCAILPLPELSSRGREPTPAVFQFPSNSLGVLSAQSFCSFQDPNSLDKGNGSSKSSRASTTVDARYCKFPSRLH